MRKMLAIMLAVVVIISPLNAFADTILNDGVGAVDGKLYLNYEIASELAYKNSKSLKDLARDIEITEEKRSRANEMVNFAIPMAAVGGDAAHAALYSLVNTFFMVDKQLQINQKNYDMEKEKIAYQVEAGINNLVKARNDLLLAEDNLKLTEQEYKIAKLKADLKMISVFDLLSAEQAYLSAREAYKGKEANLAVKELEIKKLTGIKDVASYNLDIDVVYETLAMREIDIDTLATNIRSEAPTVFIYEQLEYLAQQSVDSYTYNQNTLDTYQVKKLEAEQARVDTSNHRQAMSDAVYSIYLGIQELEAGYEELLINKEKLEAAISNTELMVDQGLMAKIELTRLGNNMLALQNQRYALELQHQELIHTLYKPWVMQVGK